MNSDNFDPVPTRHDGMGNDIRVRDRIAVRQASYVVVAVVLVGMLLTAAQIIEDYFDHREGIDRSAQQLLATIQQPAAQAAFMVDQQLAREVATGLFAHEAVVEVSITTDYGDSLAEISRETRESSWLAELLFSDRRAFSLALTGNQQEPSEVGTVAITMDPLIVGEAFLVRAERALAYGLLRAAVLSFVIALLFYRTLTRPLLTLIRALGAVDARRPDAAAITAPPGHERDEIGHLVHAANSLLGDVGKNRQRLQEARSEADRLRRRAEEASQAKTRFLATMSHELRTPLNAILGFSEMIRDQVIGKIDNLKYCGYAQDIHSSGRHLLHLINEILDISKIEAGKMELSPSAVSLQTLLRSTMRVIEMRAHENHLRLKIDMPESPQTIWADKQAIKQVVLNLLSNAVKFTPPGGTVTLRARVEGAQVSIDVSDTGIGMSSSELERAFLPFEQADNRYQLSSESGGGTGLGLALVQRLVELHDGRVDITSIPNQGTTVTIVLPVNRPDMAQRPPDRADGDAQRHAATEPATAMVLPGRQAAERQAA